MVIKIGGLRMVGLQKNLFQRQLQEVGKSLLMYMGLWCMAIVVLFISNKFLLILLSIVGILQVAFSKASAIINPHSKNPEGILNNSDDVLKAVLGTIAEGILVVDDSRKILYHNDVFKEMWSIPEKIIESRDDLVLVDFVMNQLLDPDDFVRKIEKIVKDYKEDKSILYLKDGRIYERYSKPFLMNNNRCGRVWRFKDITEQMGMTEDLKVKKKIIESSFNAIAYTDMEGKITYANKSFLDLFGYEDFEEIRNINGEIFSADANMNLEISNSLRTNGKWAGEGKGKRKDQSVFSVECFAYIIYDKEEKPIYIEFFLNDISKRKEAEKQLMRSQALYRQLIELLPNPVFLMKDEKIIMTNKEGQKFTQCDEGEKIIGKHYKDIFKTHNGDWQRLEERMGKLLKEDTTVDFLEEQLILKDGSIVDVEVAGASFTQDEEHYWVAVIQDISQRKKIERLQHHTQLFSNISHELKTPLNIILGSIQLLENLQQDTSKSNIIEEEKQLQEVEGCINRDKCHKFIRIMKQNCLRLLRLMNNLIDLTKVDNGFLMYNFGSYNIIEIVEDITQSVEDYGKTKELSILFDTNVEEKFLLVDPDKIERILLNLLSNAMKFTEKGGNIMVRIQDLGDIVRISVKDTGIGIPEDRLDEIFERFKQVGSPLHQKNEGSGIGLSLVKALVEAHHGRITVKSKLGEGSEFIIELPTNWSDEGSCENHELINISAREVNVERICIEFSDVYSSKM